MRNVIFRAAAGLILAAFSLSALAAQWISDPVPASCAGGLVEQYTVNLNGDSPSGVMDWSGVLSFILAADPGGASRPYLELSAFNWSASVGSANLYGYSSPAYGGSTPYGNVTVECVEQPFCEYEVGEQFTGGAFILGEGGDLTVSQNDTFCYQTCEVTLKGGGLVFSASGATSVPYYYEVTNAFCELEQESPPTGPGASGLGPDEVFGCEIVAGLDVCLSSDPACIVIEGEKICESSAGGVCGPDECLADGVDLVKNPNGSELGKPDIDAPPAPDTGTEGEKAPPDLAVGSTGLDGVLGTGDGETSADYWAPGTAGNSTTNGGGEGDCDPGTEECDGEGDGDGDCDPETESCECVDDPETPDDECGDGGGGSCPEGEDCGFTSPKSGGGYSDPASEIPAKQQAIDDQLELIRAELSAMKGDALNSGSAELPCTSFEFFGHEIPFCMTPYEEQLSVVATVVIAGACFLALVIIFL